MSSYKDTFVNLLVKTHFKEEKDEREYDYEGDMAMSQLKSIINNAQKLHDMLDENTNLPEWVQLKITLAEDYVVTAANYMEGEMNEEIEQVDEKVEIFHKQGLGADMERYHKDTSNPAAVLARKKAADAARTSRVAGDLKAKKMGQTMSTGNGGAVKAVSTTSQGFKKEELELDEAQKKLRPSYWRAEWRLGTESDVDKNNKKIFDKLAKTDPVKASAFHDNLMRMKKKDVKEEVEQIDELKKSTLASYVKKKHDQYHKNRMIAKTQKQVDWLQKDANKNLARAEKRLDAVKTEEVEEGAKDWKKAFGAVSTKNLNKDLSSIRGKVRRLDHSGLQPKVDMTPKVTAAVSKKGSTKVDEEVRYFSGTTVSGKPWKFIPPGEPKMLSPEFVKDRVPTLTDKEAHEVSVVAKDQYNDVEKKFAEMSEAKTGTVPKTPREKELAAKAHPKHLITRKDVLHARGVKLGEEELREKIREKLGAPGKTMTKKPADPVVFHPLGKKKGK